jgi:hypothetical protein
MYVAYNCVVFSTLHKHILQKVGINIINFETQNAKQQIIQPKVIKIQDYLLRNSDQICMLLGDVAGLVAIHWMACTHLFTIKGHALWCGCCSHLILDCEVWHPYLNIYVFLFLISEEVVFCCTYLHM